MRRPLGGWAVLLICLAQMGCLWQETNRPKVLWERLRKSGIPQGPNVVVLDVAVIERPLNDRFLAEDIWQGVDEQVLGSELKALFHENGVRVGLIAGLVPDRLQQLLTNDRNISQSRRVYLQSGNSGNIDLPAIAGSEAQNLALSYIPQLDSKPSREEFAQAEVSFSITPQITESGHVRLRGIPKVSHGDRKNWTVTEGNWAIEGDRPTRLFEELTWNIPLAANEYLLLGPTNERAESLGNALFLRFDPQAPRRQLVLIRLGQAVSPSAEPLLFGEAATNPQSPPIAVQANYPALRPKSE